MKNYVLIIICLLPAALFSQKKGFLKINTAALAMGTYEIGFEKHLGSISALDVGFGFRSQRLDSGQTPAIQALGRFRGQRNLGLSGTVGIRFFEDNQYEHPFVAIHLVGAYYDETVTTVDEEVMDFSGFRLGGTLTLGFSFPIGNRLGLDVAMQMGYAPPRKRPEPGNYYLPNLGYVVYDFNILSISGGHFQPIFALRYKVQRSSRERIRR